MYFEFGPYNNTTMDGDFVFRLRVDKMLKMARIMCII